MLATILAGAIVVIVFGSLLFSWKFNLLAFASAFIIGLFILALPILQYVPALESAGPQLVGDYTQAAERDMLERKEEIKSRAAKNLKTQKKEVKTKKKSKKSKRKSKK